MNIHLSDMDKLSRVGANNLFKEHVYEDYVELNSILLENLLDGKSFSCIRIGNTENYILNTLYSNNTIDSTYHYNSLCDVAGVFPKDLNFYYDHFLPESIENIKSSDIVGWVPITQPLPTQKFSEDLLKDKICFTCIGVLDPCVLSVEHEIPWTMGLKNKKVLIVSSMEKSILKQWKNKKNIWGDNVDKILPFELVGVIKSPHPPHIEGGSLYSDFGEMKTWIDVKKFLEKEIEKYEYDVLLVGCGALSPCLSSYAKKRGKAGITLCSNVQLLFGIYGNRWKLNNGFTHFHQCFNDYWISPLNDDIPKNKNIVEGSEGLCYW